MPVHVELRSHAFGRDPSVQFKAANLKDERCLAQRSVMVVACSCRTLISCFRRNPGVQFQAANLNDKRFLAHRRVVVACPCRTLISFFSDGMEVCHSRSPK